MTEVELRQDIKQKLPHLMQKLSSMDESELQQLQHILDAVLEKDDSASTPKKKRRAGTMKGLIQYADDWDSDEVNEEIARDFYQSEIFPKNDRS
ncbi:MAG: hypothetical protein AAF632_21850 [Bacteroidota bacterium]